LHLIGDGQPKRLGNLQIDDEFKFGWLQNWQIAGFLALKNSTTVNLAGGLVSYGSNLAGASNKVIWRSLSGRSF
jgi:hypothetical protein